jgi:hypothetical protein
MKDFFDGTFWKWFGIGFFLTSVWMLLNFAFKTLRDYWFVFFIAALLIFC